MEGEAVWGGATDGGVQGRGGAKIITTMQQRQKKQKNRTMQMINEDRCSEAELSQQLANNQLA